MDGQVNRTEPETSPWSRRRFEVEKEQLTRGQRVVGNTQNSGFQTAHNTRLLKARKLTSREKKARKLVSLNRQ